MISFDQVLLLEERVESAVKKIEQLNAENAALRAKVAELSNALNAKSEQFSSFQSDQSKIEEGILKALSRLNAVENVVLHSGVAAQSVSSSVKVQKPLEQAIAENFSEQPAAQSQSEPGTNQVVASIQPENPGPVQNPVTTFDSMTVSEQVSQPSVSTDSAPLSNKEPETVQAQEPVSDTFTPDVDFEFGETEAPSSEQAQPAQSQNSDSSQPMFDIF